jgi:hypothetical protein
VRCADECGNSGDKGLSLHSPKESNSPSEDSSALFYYFT